MRTFKFYKEPDSRWYVDLPEWTGDKADLEMVEGADAMLEMYADGQSPVFINISESEFAGSDMLRFEREADEINNGAFYRLRTCRGIDMNLRVWLCDVTKFIYGGFPGKLFISVVS